MTTHMKLPHPTQQIPTVPQSALISNGVRYIKPFPVKRPSYIQLLTQHLGSTHRFLEFTLPSPSERPYMSIVSPCKRQVAHAAHIQGLLPQDLHFPRTDLPSRTAPVYFLAAGKKLFRSPQSRIHNRICTILESLLFSFECSDQPATHASARTTRQNLCHLQNGWRAHAHKWEPFQE